MNLLLRALLCTLFIFNTSALSLAQMRPALSDSHLGLTGAHEDEDSKEYSISITRYPLIEPGAEQLKSLQSRWIEIFVLSGDSLTSNTISIDSLELTVSVDSALYAPGCLDLMQPFKFTLEDGTQLKLKRGSGELISSNFVYRAEFETSVVLPTIIRVSARVFFGKNQHPIRCTVSGVGINREIVHRDPYRSLTTIVSPYPGVVILSDHGSGTLIPRSIHDQ